MNYQFLSNTRLFRGISMDELEKMLTCFSVQTKQYEKGSLILRAGQTVSAIGLVLSGNITIENNDLWGNRTVMDRLGAGAIFAESYALTQEEILMVDIVANEPTEVLFLQTRTILNPCQKSCYSHHALLGNLLAISSQKNLHIISSIPRPRPSAAGSYPICPFMHKKRATTSSTSPLTANNWQIILGSTAVPSPTNSARCSAKAS